LRDFLRFLVRFRLRLGISYIERMTDVPILLRCFGKQTQKKENAVESASCWIALEEVKFHWSYPVVGIVSPKKIIGRAGPPDFAKISKDRLALPHWLRCGQRSCPTVTCFTLIGSNFLVVAFASVAHFQLAVGFVAT
jgi:hypothetical protein